MPKLSPAVCGATYASTERSSDAFSASVTGPRNSTALKCSPSSASASSRSPRPATSTRSPGWDARSRGSARHSTCRPLRGSSMRPRNASVGACSVPCHRGRTGASAKTST